MKDCAIASLQRKAGLPRRCLKVGWAVEVRRGVLAGMSGTLIGFNRNHQCVIELDVVQRGVMLVIDPAAVKECGQVLSMNTSDRGPQ